MCLSLSANVYCLVRGEFSTNGEGLLLTSNATADKAGTGRTVPSGGFCVFSGEVGPLAKNDKADYKHTFMTVTTLMEACTSQCATRACPHGLKSENKPQRGHVESYYCG